MNKADTVVFKGNKKLTSPTHQLDQGQHFIWQFQGSVKAVMKHAPFCLLNYNLLKEFCSKV